MSERKYLIWSNEHGKWWRPRSSGYTAIISSAGRYAEHTAKAICTSANAHLSPREEPNEVMVPAPEDAA